MSDCCGTDGTSSCGHPTEPFAELASKLPPEATAVRTAGFGVLRHGRPATATALAEITGVDLDSVREVLAAMVDLGAAELDDQGKVMGIGGLSLNPSAHELILEGVGLHTWCALDAVGIPAALGVDATARSRCRWCDKEVEVAVHAGTPEGSSELTTWLPQLALNNLRRDFCAAANLFCTRGHLDAWLDAAGKPAGEALTLAEVVERGRRIWALEAQAGTSA